MRIVRYFKNVYNGETRSVYRFEETDTGVWAERFDAKENAWVDWPYLVKNMVGLGHSDYDEIEEAEARAFVENVKHGTFIHPHDREKTDVPASRIREMNEEDTAITLSEDEQTASRFCGISEKIGHEPVTDEERERLKRIAQTMQEQEKPGK